MKRLIVASLIVTCLSCSTPPAPKQIKTTTSLKAGQWVSCWELCGKGNRLIEINETHCLCRHGKSFLHGFKLTEKRLEEPAPVEVLPEPAQSVNILEYLGIKP